MLRSVTAFIRHSQVCLLAVFQMARKGDIQLLHKMLLYSSLTTYLSWFWTHPCFESRPTLTAHTTAAVQAIN